MEGLPKISSTTGMEKYVADGNEVVRFKLARSPDDLKSSEGAFQPAMCHQIFNEQETIFGYENLRIDLNFTAGSLKTHLDISYKSKASAGQCDGVEADDILDKLQTVLAPGYTTNLDDFSKIVSTETANFRPPGTLVNSFTHLARNAKKLPPVQVATADGSKPLNGTAKNGIGNGATLTEKSFEIYYCDASEPKLKTYLERMQQFLLFFVDAASFIDISDEKWKAFIMYEKYRTPEGNHAWAFVGYSTVYNFFAYPSNIRPRVAQMLILSPFQRQGLGVSLLSTIYSYYRADSTVTEITVEDPSDDFEMLRDFVDARDCMKLEAYAAENLKKGVFSKEMAEQAAKSLKMTKRQARRMYELLRLRTVNINNDKEFKEYRLDVKRRLNIPYQKQENDIKRMIKRKCNSVELQQAAQLDDASRKTELESNFQNLLNHYQNVLRRLDKHV